MDSSTKRNKDHAFLNFYAPVMRCESVALRKPERTGDTEGARQLSQHVRADSWSQVTSCSRGCRWQQTTAVGHQSSVKGRVKRKIDKGKKEGKEDVMARGEPRDKGE